MLSDTLRVAEVVLDIPTRALESSFTYLVPPELSAEVGQCVEVEFSHRPSIGYIIDISERPAADFGDISLRPIVRVLSESYFDEVSAQLACWIANEYLSTLPEAVRLLMPPGASPKFSKLANGEYEYVPPTVAPVDDRWVSLTEDGRAFKPRKSAVKQAAVIAALSAGEMRIAELGIEISGVSSVLKTMESKGLVAIERRRKIRGSVQSGPTQGDIQNLTAGQTDALVAIDKSIQAACGEVVVIDGVTGSGKTEVYP